MSSTPRRIGLVILTALIWLGVDTALLACPVCFQVEESAAVDGLRVAVLILATVTAGVLIGFAAFIGRIIKRSRTSS